VEQHQQASKQAINSQYLTTRDHLIIRCSKTGERAKTKGGWGSNMFVWEKQHASIGLYIEAIMQTQSQVESKVDEEQKIERLIFNQIFETTGRQRGKR
jgi:hypothetical protein